MRLTTTVKVCLFNALMLMATALPAGQALSRAPSSYGSETLFKIGQDVTQAGASFELGLELFTPTDEYGKYVSDLVDSMKIITPPGMVLDSAGSGAQPKQQCPDWVIDQYLTRTTNGHDGWQSFRPADLTDHYPCNDSLKPTERRPSKVGEIEKMIIESAIGKPPADKVKGMVIYGAPQLGELARYHYFIKSNWLVDLEEPPLEDEEAIIKPTLITVAVKERQGGGYSFETVEVDRASNHSDEVNDTIEGDDEGQLGQDPDAPLPGYSIAYLDDRDQALEIYDVSEMDLKLGGRYAPGLLKLPAAGGSHPVTVQLRNREYGDYQGSPHTQSCDPGWGGWEYLNVGDEEGIREDNDPKCEEDDNENDGKPHRDYLEVANQRPVIWLAGFTPDWDNMQNGLKFNLNAVITDPDGDTVTADVYYGSTKFESMSDLGNGRYSWRYNSGDPGWPKRTLGFSIKAKDFEGKQSLIWPSLQILQESNAEETGDPDLISCGAAKQPNLGQPYISYAGFGLSTLSKDKGGNFQALAFVDDPQTLTDIDKVEVYFYRQPTGLLLKDNGRSGDFGAHDGVYGAKGGPYEPSLFERLLNLYQLEIVATDMAGHRSPMWPCITLWNGPAEGGKAAASAKQTAAVKSLSGVRPLIKAVRKAKARKRRTGRQKAKRMSKKARARARARARR